MNKKHLSKSKVMLVTSAMVILHCLAVMGVYLLAEGGFSIGTIGFSYDVPELLCFAPFVLPLAANAYILLSLVLFLP